MLVWCVQWSCVCVRLSQVGSFVEMVKWIALVFGTEFSLRLSYTLL